MEDPLESTDFLKVNDEHSTTLSGPQLQQVLRSTRVKWQNIDDVMSIPWPINWEKEVENDKLKYATLWNKQE